MHTFLDSASKLFAALVLAAPAWSAPQFPPGVPPIPPGGGGGGGQEGDEEEAPADDEPAREGTSQEIDPLIFAYEFAKVSDDSQNIARAVRAFRPFNNDSLLSVVKPALEREASKRDEERILATLEPSKRKNEELVEQLLWRTSAGVVRAGADIAARMGSKKSLDVLNKALRAKNVRVNPYARAAVIEALARHPSESPKTSNELMEFLLEYDEQGFEENGFRPLGDDRAGTPCVDVLVETVRYFEKRGTKELDLVTRLADLLSEGSRPGVAEAVEKKPAEYRAGRAAAAAAVGPAAADALFALTGTRFEPTPEGREAALAHVAANVRSLGLE
jgi:hypothetical protein